MTHTRITLHQLRKQRANLELEFDHKFGSRDWTYHDLMPSALDRFADLDEAIRNAEHEILLRELGEAS